MYIQKFRSYNLLVTKKLVMVAVQTDSDTTGSGWGVIEDEATR